MIMCYRHQSDNIGNFKSLLRRIQSNASHPDPYKRLSSVLCYSKLCSTAFFMPFLQSFTGKLLSIIREEDSLVDHFMLDITHTVLNTVKLCHNAVELQSEVIQSAQTLLGKIDKVLMRKFDLLSRDND